MAESRILYTFRNITSYKIGGNIFPGLAPRSWGLRYVRASSCDLSFGADEEPVPALTDTSGHRSSVVVKESAIIIIAKCLAIPSHATLKYPIVLHDGFEHYPV